MKGEGTQSNPYIVETPQDFVDIRNGLMAYYKLANDIDMSPLKNYPKINTFGGTIDGDGYKVKNLTSESNGDNALFGFLVGKDFQDGATGTIKNIGFTNLKIVGATYTAGLARQVRDGAIVENVYLEGQVKITEGTTGNQTLSGLAYRIMSGSTVINSYTNLEIVGTRNHSNVQNLYGFCRYIDSSTTVKNCHSNGIIDVNNPDGTHGFSSQDGYSISCYYNIDNLNKLSDDEMALTANQMKDESSFTGWDFDNVWRMGNEYPELRVFGSSTNQEEREITSYIGELATKVSVDIKKAPESQIVNVKSYLDSISSHTAVHIQTNRNVVGYLSRLDSNVTAEGYVSNKDNRRILGYMKPIYSNVNTSYYRQPIKMVINVNGYVGLIDSHIKTDSRTQYNPIFVSSYYQVNPSHIKTLVNSSNTYSITNPSYVEVIE